MNLSISNIAWTPEQDHEIYRALNQLGFKGLEIAPTRLYPQEPYTHISEASAFARALYEQYSLRVCSMQSIWFGRTERLFGEPIERELLLDYTRQAVLFAEALGCSNLVFGSPKNRVLPNPSLRSSAVAFMQQAGDFAAKHDCVIAIEPNPDIYGTNFINTTEEAIAFCHEVGSIGCMVNADLGAMIHNGEPVSILMEQIEMIHHIHVSEPMLAPIARRTLHHELCQLNYKGWISIEMKQQDGIDQVLQAAEYLLEVLS